jgi:hypothetical protein
MTRAPYYIRALLDIHCVAFPDVSNAVLGELQNDGLIEQMHTGHWKTTSRGKAYTDMLCDVPLPVQKWLDPRAK